MRIPVLQILLLFSRSLDTNSDCTRVICDGWLELSFKDSTKSQNLLSDIIKLRAAWDSLLETRLSVIEKRDHENFEMPERLDELQSNLCRKLAEFIDSKIQYKYRRILSPEFSYLYTTSVATKKDEAEAHLASKGGSATEDDSPSKDDAPTEDDSLTKDDATTEDDSPMKGDSHTKDDSLMKGDASTEDNSSTKGDSPTYDDSPMKGDTPSEDDSPTDDDKASENSATDKFSVSGKTPSFLPISTSEPHPVKGGLRVNKYLTYGCIRDDLSVAVAKGQAEFLREHYHCPTCEAHLVCNISERLEHDKLCYSTDAIRQTKPEKAQVVQSESAPASNPLSKQYLCSLCDKEYSFTPSEILKHKRTHR